MLPQWLWRAQVVNRWELAWAVPGTDSYGVIGVRGTLRFFAKALRSGRMGVRAPCARRLAREKSNAPG